MIRNRARKKKQALGTASIFPLPVNDQNHCAMILSLLPAAYFSFLAVAVPPRASQSVKWPKTIIAGLDINDSIGLNHRLVVCFCAQVKLESPSISFQTHTICVVSDKELGPVVRQQSPEAGYQQKQRACGALRRLYVAAKKLPQSIREISCSQEWDSRKVAVASTFDLSSTRSDKLKIMFLARAINGTEA